MKTRRMSVGGLLCAIAVYICVTGTVDLEDGESQAGAHYKINEIPQTQVETKRHVPQLEAELRLGNAVLLPLAVSDPLADVGVAEELALGVLVEPELLATDDEEPEELWASTETTGQSRRRSG